MSDSRVRVGGSGWTSFKFRGDTIAWAQTVQETAPAPVAAAQAIQPLDAEYPKEIVTPRAVGAGTLRLTLFELWEGPVWQQLLGFESANNILDIFKTQVKLGEIQVSKIIKNPSGAARVYVYHNCVITDVDDGESITLGTTIMPKGLTVMFTRRTLN